MHHRNKANDRRCRETEPEDFGGDLRTKSKQKWNKIRHITASITQTAQITTDKLMDWICRYGKQQFLRGTVQINILCGAGN